MRNYRVQELENEAQDYILWEEAEKKSREMKYPDLTAEQAAVYWFKELVELQTDISALNLKLIRRLRNKGIYFPVKE